MQIYFRSDRHSHMQVPTTLPVPTIQPHSFQSSCQPFLPCFLDARWQCASVKIRTSCQIITCFAFSAVIVLQPHRQRDRRGRACLSMTFQARGKRIVQNRSILGTQRFFPSTIQNKNNIEYNHICACVAPDET